MLSLMHPDVPPPIQAAAEEALAAVEEDVAARALERWDTASPELRNRLFTLLVQKPAGALAILQRAADTETFAASLSPARRQVLANHDDAQVRERAKAVLAAAAPRRGEVIARYRPASAIAGDVARGKAVFQRVCIVCHRLDGVGGLVGPDLAALTDRSDEILLESILDPNRAVRDDQAMYAVTLRDGRSFFGRIAADENHHLTVVTIDGEHHVLARKDIATQRHTGLSLMPEGLETQITIPQMADLLAYLRIERRPRREFPGNLPAVIAPAADGSVQLLATNCEIYGDSLVFEADFDNLGYWHGRGDQAIWTVDLPAATTFVVELDFACADTAAGNTFVFDGGAAPLRGTVAATGGWNHYVHARVGELELPAGRGRVTLHAYGELRSALMDLRGVHLVPR
jgi:putative heme-binding domain-containing protein